MNFVEAFTALTDYAPFPWQEALYARFVTGDIPASCNLPTGLGKTSVIAIWLIALANHPDKMPRRLVYVVNRRTVVDQTTDEVEKYVRPLTHNRPPYLPILLDLSEKLRQIGSDPKVCPLALSTLRGQFADNREWSADPSRPAVICGTVDMIGSRLLFSGYGLGFKSRPLHAGFLGQDVLLVHDEAHLEPAFQKLIEAIQQEQQRCKEFQKFHVMELTATSRGSGSVFTLSDKDREVDEVKKRIGASKTIKLHEVKDERRLAEEIAELALKHTSAPIPHGDEIHLNEEEEAALDRVWADRQNQIAEQGSLPRRPLPGQPKRMGQPKTPEAETAVLVFVRKVDDVEKIIRKLPRDKAEQLTGTLRGLERDGLVKKPIFQRFLPESNRDKDVTMAKGTVFLVCTSAGEVGVNISSDHLVCDLSTFESMAQRFGRVNRFGNCTDTRIDIVYPKEFEDDDTGSRLKKTFGLLELLNGDGSPAALGNLDADARVAAFAKPPEILPTSGCLFDAWALTTIKGALPARPIVEPYLHGVEDEKSFDTEFAWREEVELLTGKVNDEALAEWLDDYPLKPHETLRIPTFGRRRAYEQLELIAARVPELPAWVIEPDGKVTIYSEIKQLIATRGNDYLVPLASRTVVLPPKAGGLTKIGTLDGDAVHTETISYDVAGTPSPKVQPLLRLKVVPGDEGGIFKPVAPTAGWPEPFSVEYQPNQDRWKVLNDHLKSLKNVPAVKVAIRFDLTTESEDDAPAGTPTEYLVLRAITTKKADEVKAEWPALDGHLTGVCNFAEKFCNQLNLDPKLSKAVSLAAAWHDLGKGRGVWQRGAGNNTIHVPVAKPLHGRPPENLNHFRHELGSMVDVVAVPEIAETLEPDLRELVLHLIATHHGHGRPHFPVAEGFDQERPHTLVDGVVTEVPTRFAKLVEQYGRWGLAYLESLLRAADALESKRIGAAPISDPVVGSWPERPAKLLPFTAAPNPESSIAINVDLTNPGQFFACCGLFELANRLWSGAEAWFDNDKFHIACDGTLSQVLDSLVGCTLTNTMTREQHARFKELESWSLAKRKSNKVEEEYKELDKLRREAPIVLKEPFNVTLDWFTDAYAGGSRFKTWAGRQSVLDISKAMKDALNNTEWRNEACLSFSVKECGLPFNFDSNLGGQGGAIDIGFSFDPLAGSELTRIKSSARPALELLAFIGLQRFRPTEIKGENRFIYTAWNRPLPIQVAMPAACGAMPVAGASRYEFKLLYRTKYLKSFLPAIPFNGDPDE